MNAPELLLTATLSFAISGASLTISPSFAQTNLTSTNASEVLIPLSELQDAIEADTEAGALDIQTSTVAERWCDKCTGDTPPGGGETGPGGAAGSMGTAR